MTVCGRSPDRRVMARSSPHAHPNGCRHGAGRTERAAAGRSCGVRGDGDQTAVDGMPAPSIAVAVTVIVT
jgi:hypothetical protein